jgi:1,4-dihydroxy-2-naphthoate octaprenyltransferase
MTTTSPRRARASVGAWLLAARPATLTAAVAPVLVGVGAARHDGQFRPVPFVATLAAAILIQIGTNLANDVSDFERGADARGRLGPPRVTQSGLLSAGQVRLAMALVFGAAAAIGLYLTAVSGWPILVVGALAIVAGIAYTGGPWPYGYHSLGDVFVFSFFGVIAVTGTYYVQAEEVTALPLAASLPVALTVTAILVVNNLRDIETDRSAGKRTLAVLLGDRLTRAEYVVLIVAPYFLIAGFVAAGTLPAWAGLCFLTAPLSLVLTATVARGARGRELNDVLKRTSWLHLALGTLLALGLLL